MEDLQKRHRQEQKELQNRITQKKKQASKKTRKGVNDECAELERQLREKQAKELESLDGHEESESSETASAEADNDDPSDHGVPESSEALDLSLNGLSLSSSASVDSPVKKPSRQKARLARRAAEQEALVEEAKKEAEKLPDLRERERQSMRDIYESKGLKEQEIRSDGHCLYAAVADQLQDHGIGLAPKIELDIPEFDKSPTTLRYKSTRQVAASYIAQHPHDFEAFLDSPLDEYVSTIRNTGEWGGHLEIQALAKAYCTDIKVLQADGRVETIESGEANEDPLWLAYYRHSHGLGEHYNSLRQAKT